MNLKQLIVFGIENSQEPVIKNPVLRAALEEPRTMAQEPRIGLQDGQLVAPSVDGSRPGYNGWTDYSNPTKKQKQIAEKVYKKDFHKLDTIKKYGIVQGDTTGRMGVTGSGGVSTTEQPSLIKKVEKILKQNIEKKGGANVFKFEKGVIKSGYAKNGLIDKIIKGTDGKLKNLGEIKKLIDRITKENGWLTKQDYRKWAIVDSFMKDYGINDEFTGKGKYDARVNEFKLKKIKGHGNEFKEIHQTFKNWIKGDFEVEGYDRSKFDDLQNKNLKNWKPVVLTEKMIQLETELKWLNDVNTKYPDWTQKRVENAFNNKFKKNQYWSDTTFKNRSIDLYGTLVHGKTKNGRVIEGVDKGNRSRWVKNVMGEVKGGNYYRFLIAADKYEADGRMQLAKKFRNAAKDLFIKPEGEFYGLGQAEHPWFSNYGGSKGLMQIDSLVAGDLNSFKANNFEIPIRNLIKDYEKKGIKPGQQSKILSEINLRRKFLNAMTDIGDGGMARNVTFDSTSKPGKIIPINKTQDIYKQYLAGEVDPIKLQTKGTDYRNKLVQNLTEQDVKILKKDQTIKTSKIGFDRMKTLLENLGCPKPGKASGGRVGFQGGTNCAVKGRYLATTLLGKGTANTEQKAILNEIMRMGSGLMRGVGQMLNPKEFFKLRNLIGPGAWAAMGAFEAGIIGYETINNNTPLNEVLSDNWVTGWAMPWTKKEAQIENLEKANISGSPAMQKYMEQVKLMAEYEREYKALDAMKAGITTPMGETKFSKLELQDQEEKLYHLNKEWSDLQATPEGGGELEFQKAVSDMAGERKAGHYDPSDLRNINEYGYADVGESAFKGLPLIGDWFKQGTPIKKDPQILRKGLPPQLSTSGYHTIPKYDVDLTKYEKQPGVAEATTTPVGVGELEGITQYMRDVGYRHPRFGEMSEEDIELIQAMKKWRQLFAQSPTGLHGARFAGGGLTRTVAPGSEGILSLKKK